MEHKRRTCAEAEQTAAEIMDAFERAAGRLCWVVYHDGGYTPEWAATGAQVVVGWSEDGGAAEHTAQAAQPERAGWGYMRKVYKSPNQPGTGRPQVLPPCSTEPRHSPVTCHGPVQLDDRANDFSGCVRLSNNTAELSAVPQILAHFLMWKLRNPVEGWRAHIVLVYDSQLTKDACDVPTDRRHIPPKSNETVAMLSRRLLQAVEDSGSAVTWVKTRGHADKYIGQADVSAAAHHAVLGNQAADNAATAGQRGKRKGVMNLEQYLRQHLH